MTSEDVVTTSIEQSETSKSDVLIESAHEVQGQEEHYFYYFVLVFFDPMSIDTYLAPLAFFWPFLLLVVRRFSNHGFLLVVESGFNGFTTWVLGSIALNMQVIIGWYVGVLGALLYWIFILLRIKLVLSR